MPLLCKDCKYFRRTWDGAILSPFANKYAKCAHPKSIARMNARRDPTTLVAGHGRRKPAKIGSYCTTERESAWGDDRDCGPSGQWWEAR
jgi:hypothetical protein